jgi:hypothetical protein
MGLDAYYQQLREYYDGAKYRYDYQSLRKQILDERPDRSAKECRRLVQERILKPHEVAGVESIG